MSSQFGWKNFSFDSILVRLKVCNVCPNPAGSAEFRFHTGSIKSHLKREKPQQQFEVSIPYWFD